MANSVKRGNMRNVLDFELSIRVLHVGPGTTKEDMEKFTEKEIVSIPEENAFFIKGLGVPVMRWNYVIKMGKSLHIATEEELRHSIPYIVHQFKKVGAERMVEDGFNIAVDGVEPEEKPRLSQDEAAEHSFTYSETELYPGSAKGGVPDKVI